MQKLQISFMKVAFSWKKTTLVFLDKTINSKSNKMGCNKNVAFPFVNKKYKAHAD